MKFLLTILIIFCAFVIACYFFVQKNQVSPQQSVVNVAKSIFRYPNAKTWDVSLQPKFCLQGFFECGNSVPVVFTSTNTWQDIYNYYKVQMTLYGWKTNSQVFTSIPSGIVFVKDNCEAELSPVLGFMSDAETGNYNFQVNCNNRMPVL